MQLNDMPLEILVRIAEEHRSVWYNLSITIREFGEYSIHDKKRALRLFGFSEHKDFYRHHYLYKGQMHGLAKQYTFFRNPLLLPSFNIEHHIRYKKGNKHGLCQKFKDGVLVYQVNYTNGEKDGIELHFFDDGTISETYLFENGILFDDPNDAIDVEFE